VTRLLRWPISIPVAGVVLLGLEWGRALPGWLVVVTAIVLGATVLVGVHHAEVVAHRVGEPMGSLVLAVAVTVIEVGLILSLMASGKGSDSLARDTVFAAVMITCNGIVGIVLVLAALRTREAVFSAEGSGSALAAVATLAVLSLVLPTFTTSSPGPTFTTSQLVFSAVTAIVVWLLFVLVQNVRNRDWFLHPGSAMEDEDEGPIEFGILREPDDHRASAAATGEALETFSAGTDVPVDDDEDDPLPSPYETWRSAALLVTSLVAVVGLAKVISPTIEETVDSAGLPHTVVGVVIAILVLLPETLAAVRNARRDRVQVSLNLAYGSAMASIGLTIPAIAIASIVFAGPITLGLTGVSTVLLALTVGVGILTVAPGRATLLQGGLHLSIFVAFLVLSAVP
jgi:Ca2+:H+ antiporter